MDIIPNKVYRGLIKGLSDTTDGKYKVYIPSLMAHDSDFHHIMARNCTSSYGKWVDPNTGEVKSIGSYIPLQIGMLVYIVFDTSNQTSGSITGLVFDQIPLNKDDQESFYLFGKTKNGTQIYVDESRDITHILHNKGKSNLILSNDKVSISVNDVSNVGNNNLSVVEVGAESIILTVGSTSLKLDESGMVLNTKDNKWEFGNKEIGYKTKNFEIDADTFSVSANKIFINGREENHINGTTTRITGGQHLSLNGSVINVDSTLNTTIQSKGATNILGGYNLNISSLSNINLSTLGLLSLSGTNTLLSGITTVLNSTTLALNASVIFEDSQIVRGMGIASSLAPAMEASIKGANLALKGTDIALTTAFHFNDPFSGMACNMMSQSLPGVAQGAPNTMPILTMTPAFDYINSVIKYINTNTEVGNVGTVDNLNSINGNTFTNVFRKN